MKLCYVCEYCEDVISEVDMEEVDDNDLSGLTEANGEDIIRMEKEEGTKFVSSLCDECISSLGLDFDLSFAGEPPLH